MDGSWRACFLTFEISENKKPADVALIFTYLRNAVLSSAYYFWN